MFALHFQMLSWVLKDLRHLKHALPFSSAAQKLPDLELLPTHLLFCSIMCQSASRQYREVGLISSATRCCHLQSTPWWCKEENKAKCGLLIC